MAITLKRRCWFAGVLWGTGVTSVVCLWAVASTLDLWMQSVSHRFGGPRAVGTADQVLQRQGMALCAMAADMVLNRLIYRYNKQRITISFYMRIWPYLLVLGLHMTCLVFTTTVWPFRFLLALLTLFHGLRMVFFYSWCIYKVFTGQGGVRYTY